MEEDQCTNCGAKITKYDKKCKKCKTENPNALSDKEKLRNGGCFIFLFGCILCFVMPPFGPLVMLFSFFVLFLSLFARGKKKKK